MINAFLKALGFEEWKTKPFIYTNDALNHMTMWQRWKYVAPGLIPFLLLGGVIVAAVYHR